MPKNLKHLFRSELIRQRRNARKLGGREKMKRMTNGKYTDYCRIYADKTYLNHLGRAKKFAQFCKEHDIKKFNQISPKFAKKYLIKEKNDGLSAATIGADALCINHLMIGSGHWQENQRLIKSKIPNMPKRSNKIALQREKPLTSAEWRQRYPHKYGKYRRQIDTIRAFGLRRRELTGGTSRNGRDGLGDRSLYHFPDGSLKIITQGKGGKIRWTTCRTDLQPEMEKLYKDKIRPSSMAPRNNSDFRDNLKINHPFYHSFSHAIPTHIFRADFAQQRLGELATKSYSGRHKYYYYKRLGHHYQRLTRYHNLSRDHTIGAYTAPFGAFYELADELGHNRLDVLENYIGEGR